MQINTVLASVACILCAILLVFVFRLNASVQSYQALVDGNANVVANYDQRLQEIEEAVVALEQDNKRITQYVNQFYGDDEQSMNTLDEVKIALDDHRAKIDSILQTINVLH